jgi:hypothetical protein
MTKSLSGYPRAVPSGADRSDGGGVSIRDWLVPWLSRPHATLRKLDNGVARTTDPIPRHRATDAGPSACRSPWIPQQREGGRDICE